MNVKKLFVSILTIATFLIFGCESSDDPKDEIIETPTIESTKLIGIVVDQSGIFVENATVIAKISNDENTETTDQFGVFSFDPIWENVELTLIVKADGMEDQTITVGPIAIGEKIELQINLQKKIPIGSQVGDLAPEFSLSDANGNPISLSDYRDQSIVLLTFNRGQY